MNSAFGMNLHIDLESVGIIRPIVSATRLESSAFAQLTSLMESDVRAHVFGLAMLERWGVEGRSGTEWWGVYDEQGSLRSVAFAGDWKAHRGFGLVVPMGDPDWASSLGAALSARGGAEWVVGEQAVTDVVWQHMDMPNPRLSSRQLLMEACHVEPGATLDLRLAGLSDLQWVHTAARQMMIDDLGIDPVSQDFKHFNRSVEASIAADSEYVAVHDALLVYRVKVGPGGRNGVQIGGIWVPPGARGRGVGQAGTRSMLTNLLREYPRVTLHVRSDNTAAIRSYLSVGFHHVRDFRLLVR